MRCAAALIVFGSLTGVPCSGADQGTYSKAIAAFDSGHRDTGLNDMQRLALAGDTRAQYFVAIELIKGEAIPQDLVQGYAWLEAAADCKPLCSSASTSQRAARLRVKLGPTLTGEQLIEAERRAEAYLRRSREQYERQARAVHDALSGSGGTGGIVLHDGCASNAAQDGCRPTPVTDDTPSSCKGVTQQPDRPVADRGPLAHVNQPHYPEEAQRELAARPDVIGAHIDHTGYVCRAGIIRSSGNEAIDRAAMSSLLTWRFQPAMLAGVNVESLFDMRIDFVFPGFDTD
jgi:TonB family protein